MSTGDSDWAALVTRLERMERQNRRTKQIGLLILLLWGATFWMAQARGSRQLETKKLVLTDAKGRKRAELAGFLGGPALVFYDAAGRSVLSIGAQEDGPGIALLGPDEQRIAGMISTSNGPLVSLHDSKGTKRLNLSVTAQGPTVGLLGGNGEAKGAFGLTANETSFLHLFSTRERGGVQLFAAPDRALVRIFDVSDRPRAVLGMIEKDGAPGLTLNDTNANARATLMLLSQGPVLNFLNKDNNVVWRAP